MTATMRVHRLSSFVVPLHCTFSPPLPDEDAVDDDGLDAARGRFVGVCKGDGRESGAELPGLAGAEFGACCSCGRCGVVGGTCNWFVGRYAPESEWGRVIVGGRKSVLGGRGGGGGTSAYCIVRDVCVCGVGIGIAGGLGRGPGAPVP